MIQVVDPTFHMHAELFVIASYTKHLLYSSPVFSSAEVNIPSILDMSETKNLFSILKKINMFICIHVFIQT